MRILYVEDNEANLSLVQRVARMGNHEVIAYTSGEDALKNFIKDKPDLVLMDVQLSGALSGLDVVRKLRQQGQKVPIVAVTAYAMVGDKERTIEAGCDAYLSKPLPVGELVEMIKRYDSELDEDKTQIPEPPAESLSKPAEATAPSASQPDPDGDKATVIPQMDEEPAPVSRGPNAAKPAAPPAASSEVQTDEEGPDSAEKSTPSLPIAKPGESTTTPPKATSPEGELKKPEAGDIQTND